MKHLTLLTLLSAGLLTGGCTYYQVTDPDTQNTYYTQKIKESKSGSIAFTDEVTGKRVTLSEHEVMKLKDRTYREEVRAAKGE
ncbi:MAG: hypothetical protein AAF710_05405 [Planctomycetota bacterium]